MIPVDSMLNNKKMGEHFNPGFHKIIIKIHIPAKKSFTVAIFSIFYGGLGLKMFCQPVRKCPACPSRSNLTRAKMTNPARISRI